MENHKRILRPGDAAPAPLPGEVTRRRVVVSGVVLASGLVVGDISDAIAQQALPPTPACDDGDEPTARQTEGPFFTPRSPERADLREPGMPGRPVVLSGRVVTRACRPVERALVDLWHADDRGEYDNRGFRLRGHVFTDAGGRYQFRTIVPGAYVGRTRHYHVKVQAPARSVLTTQLYFPDEPANRRDGLFRRDLLMRVANAGDGVAAQFDFVLDMA
jgi:protocatechuate 3,4-dioxygenase beta subunit